MKDQNSKVEINKRYRPEIEGLRIIAALLVAVYHIWVGKVSGGVDVFFVVSGFLITTSLISSYSRDGYIKFSKYILNLLKRLLPSALTVLMFVIIVGYFVLPEARQLDTIREIIASLFYYENWQLAITNTDYLAQDNAKSPVQHFWAMSIQGQFYIIWFIIISVTIIISKKFAITFKKTLLILLSLIFIGSLGFSIYLTDVNQPWAYFDVRTRMWEFAAGGILLLYFINLRLPKRLGFVLGWIGLIALVSTGLVFNVETGFPGYIALWPVISTIFIMLAGENPSKFGVEKFLGSPIMVKLGGLSYGIYLWHWPLLCYYYIIFDKETISTFHGILVILTSFILSYITTHMIESFSIKKTKQYGLNIKGFQYVICILSIIIICLGLWYFNISKSEDRQVNNDGIDENYPGAMVYSQLYDPSQLPDVEPIPNLSLLLDDKPLPFEDGCQIGVGETKVKICEYGEVENYDYTVALIGGSKSTHWHPSLNYFAKDEKIRLLNITKSGCRFSLSKDVVEDCYQWNLNIPEALKKEDIDLVITLANTADGENEIPETYIAQFDKLEEIGLPILALRDTLRFPFDVPECLSENGVNSKECVVPKSEHIPDNPPWENLDEELNNVTFVDYNDYICEDNECSPVVGNIIGFRDTHHFSKSFNESLGPIIKKDVLKKLKGK